MIIFLELEMLFDIFNIMEVDEGVYFNTCDFVVGLQLRNMALFVFPALYPPIAGLLLLQVGKHWLELGCNKTCQLSMLTRA